MANLTISGDNTTLTLQSSEADDVLDKWLQNPHANNFRYLKIDYTRNCCSSKTLSFYVYPEYVITANINGFAPYAPVPLVPSTNDAEAIFGLSGIDVNIIKSARIYTNENNPTTDVFEWIDVADVNDVVGDSLFNIYYVLGGTDQQFITEITTIDDIVYTITGHVSPGINFNPGSNTVVIDSVVSSHTPEPTIDYVGDTITFTPTVLDQDVTDGKLLDGVYNFNLSLVTTDFTFVDSVDEFFDIKLTCLVTEAVADDPTDTLMFALLESLKYSNDCSLEVSKKCKIYDALLAKLIKQGLATQVKSIGCKCGCK